MGSVREDIAQVVHYDTDNEDRADWEDIKTAFPNVANEAYRKTDQIRSLVCKRIEGAKLNDNEINRAFKDGLSLILKDIGNMPMKITDVLAVQEQYRRKSIAQAQLQAILDVIKEE